MVDEEQQATAAVMHAAGYWSCLQCTFVNDVCIPPLPTSLQKASA